MCLRWKSQGFRIQATKDWGKDIKVWFVYIPHFKKSSGQ